jgi:hypothetical protein
MLFLAFPIFLIKNRHIRLRDADAKEHAAAVFGAGDAKLLGIEDERPKYGL